MAGMDGLTVDSISGWPAGIVPVVELVKALSTWFACDWAAVCPWATPKARACSWSWAQAVFREQFGSSATVGTGVELFRMKPLHCAAAGVHGASAV